MKCKYYKTKICFSEWLFCGWKCIPCLITIQRRKENNQHKDSIKYWNKQK